jgi:hypothetical protein
MSDFEDSLNDRTADDEPEKRKPKILPGYFETFNPNDHVQVATNYAMLQCRERLLFNIKSIAGCLGKCDASGIVVLQHAWCWSADLCNPGQDTVLARFVSGLSYHCTSGQVADHCFDPRHPSDDKVGRKTEKVGHSALFSTRSVIPAVRRTGRTIYFIVISSKWTDTHEPFRFLRYGVSLHHQGCWGRA